MLPNALAWRVKTSQEQPETIDFLRGPEASYVAVYQLQQQAGRLYFIYAGTMSRHVYWQQF